MGLYSLHVKAGLKVQICRSICQSDLSIKFVDQFVNQICQSNFLIKFVNQLCQSTLSINFVDQICRSNFLIKFVNQLCRSTLLINLSISFVNQLCWSNLSIKFVNQICWSTLSIKFVDHIAYHFQQGRSTKVLSSTEDPMNACIRYHCPPPPSILAYSILHLKIGKNENSI
jgi:hypothetical protein